MNYIVLIGDIVDSRNRDNRSQLQQRFNHFLDQLNSDTNGLVSPYTITLGDEFQVVLDNGSRAMSDAIKIQAALYPAKVRFSFAIGKLSTPINVNQSIGMDGPVFHQARDGIDALKDSGGLYQIDGLNQEVTELANASLKLISNTVSKWRDYRFDILMALDEGQEVKDIAVELEISDKAVYKSISGGHIKDVLHTFRLLGELMNRAWAGN